MLVVTGDVDPESIARVCERCFGAIAPGERQDPAPFAKATKGPRFTYVDSTGIGEIVGAYTRVVREGGMLKLCGVSPRTQELLDTTNLGSVIESYPSEADALQSF